MQSHDVIGSNTQKIAQLFPNCVTERLGKDGKPELAIDFEKLQAELSNEVITEGEERYRMDYSSFEFNPQFEESLFTIEE